MARTSKWERYIERKLRTKEPVPMSKVVTPAYVRATFWWTRWVAKNEPNELDRKQK